MNRIQIYDIRLVTMQASTNLEVSDCNIEHVQAKMEISYDFSEKDKKFTYHIDVNDDTSRQLYQIQLNYQFHVNKEGFLDQEIVQHFLNEMQPRLESMLTIIAYESGCSKLS